MKIPNTIADRNMPYLLNLNSLPLNSAITVGLLWACYACCMTNPLGRPFAARHFDSQWALKIKRRQMEIGSLIDNKALVQLLGILKCFAAR